MTDKKNKDEYYIHVIVILYTMIQNSMQGVGLEPTQIALGDLKSPALTISAILATYIVDSLNHLITDILIQ